MSVELLAAIRPGFSTFLIGVTVVLAFSAVLAVVGHRSSSAKLRARTRTINRYVLLTLLSIVILFPIYITVVNSLLIPDRIARKPPTLFPTNPDWDSYPNAWSDGRVSDYLLNSVIVTFLIVAGQVSTAVLAAYAFAFLRFPLRNTIFVIFLATMMVPFEVVFFTNVQTVDTLGELPIVGEYLGLNTYGALALPFLATGFGAFLVRQSFMSLPRDLRDAAALDGYGHWRFMTRVAIPLARPAIAALGLFAFFGAWNQYLWPLVIAQEDHRTVQVGLKFLTQTGLDRINQTFAGLVLAALPLFVLLLFFQKQLVRGLTAGAVKG